VDSTRLRRIKGGPERRAATLAQEGVDALNMHWSDWTGGLTTLFHRFSRFAFGWDAQHRRQLDELLATGVDGVFSDHVDRMVEALAARS
jgi:glycerophosphoryl diester phosphodiesterase